MKETSLKPLNLLIVLCCLASSALAAPASAPASYVLENTEVRDIRAQALKRDYQLYVALPDSYRQGTKRYPVLFVVDANYSFAIVRNIAQRLNKHAGMEEVIVVGLSYANGDGGVYSRRRDYTPTTPRKHDYRSDMPGRQPAFGEAKAYGQFISGEVFPFIASNYRVDMQRKVFIGHSYGSLLGLQFLLTEPRTFEHYILGSPSLWYDAGVMFDREQAYAASHKDLACIRVLRHRRPGKAGAGQEAFAFGGRGRHAGRLARVRRQAEIAQVPGPEDAPARVRG